VPIAIEAVERIDALFAIERDINGKKASCPGHLLAVEIGELAQRYSIGDAFAQLAIIIRASARNTGGTVRPRRPLWPRAFGGSQSPTPFRHIGETDCVAGHIGYELRCAK
jgi:hypothetical protein